MNEIEYDGKRKIIAVCGKTGSGKSYITKYMVYNYFNRVVVLDIMNEYEHKDFEIFTDFNSFKEYYKDNYKEKDFKVILKFSDSIEEYEYAMELVYFYGKMMIVIEEIHNYASSKYITPVLNKILRMGRHRDISVLATSQRFNDLNLIFRVNIDVLIAHNLTMPNDIEYLSKIGFVGEEGGKRIEQLSCKNHERIIFENE